MAQLKNKWKDFSSVLFDPWVLIMLILTVGSIILAKDQTNKLVISVMNVFIALFSGVLGALLLKRWLDLTESRALVIRGKSAIRSLKILLNAIAQLEKRVIKFTEEHREVNGASKELVLTHLEEVADKTNALEEQVLNSVEDWTDIIPEAEISTKIGVISDLKSTIEDRTSQISQLQNELRDARNQSEASQKMLRDRIETFRAEIDTTKRQLREYERQIDQSVLSGISGVTSSPSQTLSGIIGTTDTTTYILPQTCKQCGAPYYSGGLLDMGLCHKCRERPTSE
jgi:hypothetical protein